MENLLRRHIITLKSTQRFPTINYVIVSCVLQAFGNGKKYLKVKFSGDFSLNILMHVYTHIYILLCFYFFFHLLLGKFLFIHRLSRCEKCKWEWGTTMETKIMNNILCKGSIYTYIKNNNFSAMYFHHEIFFFHGNLGHSLYT